MVSGELCVFHIVQKRWEHQKNNDNKQEKTTDFKFQKQHFVQLVTIYNVHSKKNKYKQKCI